MTAASRPVDGALPKKMPGAGRGRHRSGARAVPRGPRSSQSHL